MKHLKLQLKERKYKDIQRGLGRQQSESFVGKPNIGQIERQFNRFKLALEDNSVLDNISLQMNHPSTTTHKHQSGKIYNKRNNIMQAHRKQSQLKPSVKYQDHELQEILLIKQRELFRQTKQIAKLNHEMQLLAQKNQKLEDDNRKLRKSVLKAKLQMKQVQSTIIFKADQEQATSKNRLLDQVAYKIKQVQIDQMDFGELKSYWIALRKIFQDRPLLKSVKDDINSLTNLEDPRPNTLQIAPSPQQTPIHSFLSTTTTQSNRIKTTSSSSAKLKTKYL